MESEREGLSFLSVAHLNMQRKGMSEEEEDDRTSEG
jgi:hypothetical protein